MPRPLLLPAVLAATAVLAPSAGANFIVNGGFESPVTTGIGAPYTPGSTIGGPGGWPVLGDPGTNVFVLNSTYSEPANGITSFNPHSGFQSFDPTGPGNQGPSLGVSQTVATVAGAEYTLSFWVGTATPTSGPGGFYTSPGTIDLSIDGSPRVSFTNGNRTNGFIDWLQFSTTFTAAGGSTTVAFFNGTTGSAYVGLDDVTLNGPSPSTATPAPAGLLAGLVGAAGLRLARRRRA